MDASGALDSLLGRLTSILVDEAQLLGRVRGDVEFITDEMESMNGLILHLTDAQHRDHQVRAWMKQVVGLTRDCEGNVEFYVHCVGSRPGDDGVLGYLRRVLRFLRTIPVRHRIATRIRDLKVRARDVGDRRQRYGVTVPESTRAGMNALDIEPSSGEEDLRRRAVLLDGPDEPCHEEVIRSGIDTLIKCLPTEPATTEDGVPQPHVRVFGILGHELGNKVAEGLYQQHSSVSTLFGCKASVRLTLYQRVEDILEEVGVQLQPDQEEDKVTNQAAGTTVFKDKEKRLISKIHGHLKGKRFLMVVRVQSNFALWKRCLDALLQAADGCLPGSAIIMTTDDDYKVLHSSPYKIINARSLKEFYRKKKDELNAELNAKLKDELKAELELAHKHYSEEWYALDKANCGDYIIEKLAHSSNFARRMFLHLLYVKPTMADAEQDMCCNAISKGMSLNKSVDDTMVMLCYNELPSKYRSCLLHLTIFPQGYVIKTTRLTRRWTAEGLISTTSDKTESAEEKAGHYLDVLFIRGFISPVEISAAGNIKSFTLKDEVHKVLTKIAREVNIVDTNLPIDLHHHLSIHNRLGLGKSHSGGSDNKDIAAYLPSLAKSPQWQLLKVLDLEGCHSLQKQHLKSICKILLLKYLGLRNTDVAELPKQINELQCLETLDIRETKVHLLAKKHIVLPMLKNFLAGHKISRSNNDSTLSEDPFSAVQMPFCLEKMNNMEVLSHVRVSNSNELAGMAQLLKLMKLGVALHGKHAKLMSDLFRQIEKLHRCLRSLSIRIEPHCGSNIQDVGMVDPLHTIPQFIERLNISGITCGLRHLIHVQHKLTKITLSETHLKEDDLTVLGKLSALQFLRLQHNSYTESEIIFRGEDFQRLSYLLVEVKDITKIRFASGAAPILQGIVWSFARMDALLGLMHLNNLKKLELNGNCHLDPIQEELLRHPNVPTLMHKPDHKHQEDRTAAATSSSSDP